MRDEMVSLLPREIIEKIPYSFVRRHLAIPVEEREDYLLVAIADPLNVDALDELHLMFDKRIKSVVYEEEKILSLIHECYNHEEGATSKLLAGLSEEKKTKEEEGVYDLLESSGEDAPIIRLLNLILSEAIQQRASDIHFEPFENDLQIRYRIDGILQMRHAPKSLHQAHLLTRIKVLAKLDIAEHRLPQDGRIKMKMGGREIDFRVSTIPVAHGERIVLRILDRGNVTFGLGEMGMLPQVESEFRRLIGLPEGILLVTGPTGSGKTTTLYTALSETISEEINVMTVEDPVEYKLPGIAQIAVHPKIGLTFATGLRHILRQDPDVIMIGEIRDQETAEIAVQASLTGHLVLSTLHTNDAPSAITRLVDMGIEHYLLSSTVVGIVAQRLVRTICPHCREAYTPPEGELVELDLTREKLNGNKLYRGRGCSACFHTGYQGRHGIYELLTITEEIQSHIAKKSDSKIVRKIALEQGMVSLRKHGSHLVRSGITTAAEMMQVTGRV